MKTIIISLLTLTILQAGELEKIQGIKLHVTKDYVNQYGKIIVGTKGNDIFIIDADVNVKVKGNGGKDKIIVKKPKPKISFPKLPNEK